MTTQEIATRLSQLCRKGEFETAQKELFADDVISIEPYAANGFEKETKGLANIFKKGLQFAETTEKLHGIKVSEPIVTNQSFAFILDMDVTMKKGGRMNMAELCVYKVKDGKVISEEFFM
ncbi:MAG: SnoaL-like domain-containing protein [Flavitalea sp.]